MRKTFMIILIVILSVAIIFAIFYNLKQPQKITLNNIKNSDTDKKALIDVPRICQFPALPTGCEAVAATMVLRYYDEDITANEFASNWLKCNNNFYTVDNKRYGPNPNEFFVGDPFSTFSYGCYATPIINAINYNSKICRAELMKNYSLEEICTKFIDNDIPILIWATMGMKPSNSGNSWFFESNEKFTWIAGEHCLVLVGYNEKYYFLNDPQSGCTVAYEKDIVKKRYKELGEQAVYIHKRQNGSYPAIQ